MVRFIQELLDNLKDITKISCTISVHDDSSEGEDGDDFAAADDDDDDGDLMMMAMVTSAPCRCIGRRCR